MQSADPYNLGRSKSSGVGRKPPPPVKPKPSTLLSAPTELAPINSSSTTWSQRSATIVTDNGASVSTSFGDLKKTFERQKDSLPLFMAGVGNNTGYSTGSARPSAADSGHVSHASSSRALEQKKSSLLTVPSQNSRPRSLSSPAPPHLAGEDGSTESAETPKGTLQGSKNGIDNSQPDFGNLRARFQSQAKVSKSKPVRLSPHAATARRRNGFCLKGMGESVLMSIHAIASSINGQDVSRPKPNPMITSLKPSVPAAAPPPPMRQLRIPLDPINTGIRPNSPQPMSASEPSPLSRRPSNN
ncbi:hypothetical protein BGZ65_012258, partial [Modicella reniformis]